jgi:hypothetical protein
MQMVPKFSVNEIERNSLDERQNGAATWNSVLANTSLEKLDRPTEQPNISSWAVNPPSPGPCWRGSRFSRGRVARSTSRDATTRRGPRCRPHPWWGGERWCFRGWRLRVWIQPPRFCRGRTAVSGELVPPPAALRCAAVPLWGDWRRRVTECESRTGWARPG